MAVTSLIALFRLARRIDTPPWGIYTVAQLPIDDDARGRM
jgi:hypothetical protein